MKQINHHTLTHSFPLPSHHQIKQTNLKKKKKGRPKKLLENRPKQRSQQTLVILVMQSSDSKGHLSNSAWKRKRAREKRVTWTEWEARRRRRRRSRPNLKATTRHKTTSEFTKLESWKE
jgi:hypothetical protein